ncbi:DUF4334 domain-containing protein [Kovacikia minuta CCNUW1]|uniref:DUF4334 domain-containing protein n=1 Tax=Kovacikia minuta TaxID=2931930 RepID=UPI001CC99138|nr:DUF4334 domain-containing protein [Kovacikia minuta]UBF26829.1 DUF4334 domain-containing protein [Kovacikia minuta CCNUW1]
MKTFSEAMNANGVSTAEALELFDRLDTVDLNFLLGSWKGASFPTGHPLDGVLEAYHWHGKRFDNPEQVHPLVFNTIGGGTKSINPLWMMPGVSLLDRLPLQKMKAAGRIFQLCVPLFATDRSCARLRLITYRGKESATMIYDGLPINDIFRKVDETTVLGLMDLRGMKQPFFFTLQRESVN